MANPCWSHKAAASVGALLVVSCASVTPPPRFGPSSPADPRGPEGAVQRAEPLLTEGNLADVPGRAPAPDLQGEELTPESAVRIAFFNNPSLLATFEEIGISQADLLQAGRIANPTFEGFVRFPSAGGPTNVELSLVQNVFDLFIAPLRKKAAAASLEQSRFRVADAAVALSARVKEAFYSFQAQQQLAKRLRLVLDVAATAADFAERQHTAGTIADLQLETQRALLREAKVEVARTEAEALGAREKLARLLGAWGAQTAFRVGDELPALPEVEIPLEGLEATAVAERADLQAARFGVDAIGRALALKKKTRFFPVGIDVGISTEKDVTGERVTGPTLALQIPIFDTGKASIARLQAEHRRAQRELEGLAVDARSEVREARDRMIAARDLATYYRTVLLPQRVHLLDLNLRYYNSMFKGAYDLLLAKQAAVEAEKGWVSSTRDYWVARAELERALGGALPAAAEGRQP